MHSSTYKADIRLTEGSLHDIDDASFLNIRLDSLDLERAITTLDAHRSSDNRAPFFHRSPGAFGFTLAPQFSLPNISRPAICRSKTESSSKSSDQRPPEALPTAQHPLQRPAPVHTLVRLSDCKLGTGEEVRGAMGAAQRSQGLDMCGSTLTEIPKLRLSDYGRGLVSVRRDFSSSSQSLGTWLPRE